MKRCRAIICCSAALSSPSGWMEICSCARLKIWLASLRSKSFGRPALPNIPGAFEAILRRGLLGFFRLEISDVPAQQDGLFLHFGVEVEIDRATHRDFHRLA